MYSTLFIVESLKPELIELSDSETENIDKGLNFIYLCCHWLFWIAELSDLWWIRELNLYMSDKDCLENGSEVTDNIINAAQILLKHQFHHIAGFQNTLLGYHLQFVSISSLPAIQILHTGTVYTVEIFMGSF